MGFLIPPQRLPHAGAEFPIHRPHVKPRSRQPLLCPPDSARLVTRWRIALSRRQRAPPQLSTESEASFKD